MVTGDLWTKKREQKCSPGKKKKYKTIQTRRRTDVAPSKTEIICKRGSKRAEIKPWWEQTLISGGCYKRSRAERNWDWQRKQSEDQRNKRKEWCALSPASENGEKGSGRLERSKGRMREDVDYTRTNEIELIIGERAELRHNVWCVRGRPGVTIG